MNGRQILEMLARLPARVWLQAIGGLLAFIVLAVLGFAVIAGIAAVVVLAILAVKARDWMHRMMTGTMPSRPPPDPHRKVIDVQYEIVDRRDRSPRS